MFVFGTSICMLQSVIGTLFRDYEHLVGVSIRALFFITPVMYPPNLMAEHGRAALYQFNPLHYMLTCVREPILTGELPPASDLAIAAGIAIVTTVVAFRVFARYERRLYALL
jgi:ABC-2 type transport system permease protein/lipopolysaccharide transport system permease protein